MGAESAVAANADTSPPPREDLETFSGADSHHSQLQDASEAEHESAAGPDGDSDDGQ